MTIYFDSSNFNDTAINAGTTDRQKTGAKTISDTKVILMNYNFDKDDEVLDEADTIHEERDHDVQLGKRIAREKKCHALVGTALKVTPLDDDCVTSKPDNHASNAEAIIGCNLSEEDKEQR